LFINRQSLAIQNNKKSKKAFKMRPHSEKLNVYRVLKVKKREYWYGGILPATFILLLVQSLLALRTEKQKCDKDLRSIQKS
jgi:hypothetical protein